MITAGASLLLFTAQPGSAPKTTAAALSQQLASLAVDMETSGNGANSLQDIDSCTSVDVSETFPMDIVVQDVSNLVNWELYVQYDPSRLEIVSTDVRRFLSTKSGSNVINVSEPLPDRRGLYRLAAADIAIPAAPEQGEGVLATLLFTAKSAGVTPIGLPHVDFNGDGAYDLGPRLIGLNGQPIGDTDGDDLLDGSVDSGRVVVGFSCSTAPEVTPPPLGTPVSGGTPGAGATGTPGDGSGPQASSTPGAGPTGSASGDSSPTPGASGSPEDGTPGSDRTPSRTPDTNAAGEDRSPGGGGGGLDGWLVAVIAGIGALGLGTTFMVLRQVRRPGT